MKTRKDKAIYKLKDSGIELTFRYPNIREYREIETVFNEFDPEKHIDKWAQAVNSIMIDQKIEDVATVADLYELKNSLLDFLTIDQIDKKKSILQQAGTKESSEITKG